MRTRFSGEDLNSLSREELYELAQKLELSVRKNSSREKLVEALMPHAQKTAAKKATAARKSAPVKPATGKDKKSAAAKPAAGSKTEVPAKSARTTAGKKSAPSEKTVAVKKSAQTRTPVAPKKPTTSAAASDKTTKSSDKAVAKKVSSKKVAEKKGASRKTVSKVAEKEPEVVAPPKKRGRPAKSAIKTPVVEDRPVVRKSARKAVPAAPVAEETPLPEKKRGRPAKSAAKKVVEAEAPAARKRGRPARSAAKTELPPVQEEKPADATACNVSEAAVKGLARGFAKKPEDAPATPRSKKGAEVFKDGIAVPVETAETRKKPVPAAEKIEREREKRHSSLKTTMEIPVFHPVAPVEAASTIGEEELTGELPHEYGETRIVLQIRDPHWAYAYWEIPRVELKRIELEVGIFEYAHSHYVLRLHNVSQGFSQEIKLSEHARNWYIYLESPQTVYQVELGMHSPTEGYTFIALSNLVQTPPDRVAERWAAPVMPEPEPGPELVERLGGHEIVDPPPQAPGIPEITEPAQVYFMSVTGEPVPHPGSSDLLAGQRLQAPEQPSGEAPFVPGGVSSFEMPGSFGMPGSFAMPGSFNMPTSYAPTSADWTSPGSGGFGSRLPEVEDDDIFLVAAVEIIVYGRVKVGCDLTFQGNPLRVRPDGSFSLRMALPFDSGHSIDLVATDPRTGKQRVIKAAVSLKKI